MLDRSPKQIVAEMEKDISSSQISIPRPEQTMPFTPTTDVLGQESHQNFENSQSSQAILQNTVQQQQFQTGIQNIPAEPITKKSTFSPIVLTFIGISGLLLLTFIGGVGLYMSGLIGGTDPDTTSTSTSTTTNGNNLEV